MDGIIGQLLCFKDCSIYDKFQYFFFCIHDLFRNIAEALISKGLAYCLRHRQDDDQRSSQYDELMTAEARFVSHTVGAKRFAA